MTKEQPTIHVGIDVSKDKLAVAIAGGGVRDEVLSLGTFENAPASVDRLLKKLSGRGSPVSVCYEAGPTGYGLYRQVRAFGFECCVVAPSLIPVRAGERVKTDRLDAIRLARLLRAGELTPIWVPDETHEAMRDLVRARESAAEDQRHKRQLVSAFILDRRPGERCLLQALVGHHQSGPVPEKDLQPIRPLGAEHEHRAGERILLQRRLHQRGQPVMAFAVMLSSA